jgi:hypothetical protein
MFSSANVTDAGSAAQKAAAQDPKVRNVVIGVAQNAARQGAAQAKAGYIEVRHHIQQNPNVLKALSFVIALALLTFSILGMINVFNAFLKPYQYLFSMYNCVFAAIIIIADGKPEWFDRCWNVQERLFTLAAFLTSQTGRAFLNFYVGSINFFILPETWLWKIIYACLAFALCLNGFLMVLDSCGWCCCCCTKHRELEETSSLPSTVPV